MRRGTTWKRSPPKRRKRSDPDDAGLQEMYVPYRPGKMPPLRWRALQGMAGDDSHPGLGIFRSGSTYGNKGKWKICPEGKVKSQMLFRLTDHLRVVLKDPLGELVPNEERTRSNLDDLVSSPLVLVGDVTASVMTKMGYDASLILVDNHTKRGKEIPTLTVKPSRILEVKNPAGMIGGELFESLEEAVRSIVTEDLEGPIMIEVDGEEDLSTLVAIKLMPNGSTVVYGQPDSGLVVVRVDDEMKKKVEDMLQEMEV